MSRTITLLVLTVVMCVTCLASAIALADEPLLVDSFYKDDRSQDKYTLKGDFDYIAVAQGQYVIVWTRDELTDTQQDILKAYIQKADKSTAKRKFDFVTANPIVSNYSDPTLGSYLIQGNRLLCDSKKISHLDYGAYTLTMSPITPTPTISPMISPAMSPEVSPSISPALSPEVSPAISPEISPTTDISPEISPTPAVSPSTVLPEGSADPGVSASPTGSPTGSPTVTMRPSSSPDTSPSPSPTPLPIAGSIGSPGTGDRTSVLIPGIFGLLGIVLTFISFNLDKRRGH